VRAVRFWANGNPPGNAIPAVFLAVSFASLLLVVRLRIHRRSRPATAQARRRLLIDDASQATLAAGSVVLLAYGYWPGAIPALAALLWLGLSARSSVRRRRLAFLAPPQLQ
jgi:CHASE2 domain-containing sensor protein